jgi:3-deoxy-manno-octulosonate cytidylyltransferase (CMP-KDO synthetase)
MIVHTWRAAAQHPKIHEVCVATDHEDIAAAVRTAGGKAIMTSAEHSSGTDRCAEALQHWPDAQENAILNLQGDEPFPHPHHISALCDRLGEGQWEIVSAMRAGRAGDASSPHRVKVAAAADGRAVYFSRSAVPYGAPPLIHIGLYGFAPGALVQCAHLPPGRIEKQERLEQLRWLENGLSIGMVQVSEGDTPGPVDTPEDLERARNWHRSQTR